MALRAALLLLCAAAAAAAAADKPKVIIYCLFDDLGFNDIGIRSHQINTPTIDRLAHEGLLLDQLHVQDVCSPSRSTILSGRYAMHHGVVDWIPPESAYGLDINDTTLAEVLLAEGYETHAVGKWHMGFYKWDYTPTFRGFQSFLGFYSGGEDYFTHQTDGAYDMHRDKQEKCGPGCSEPAWDLQNVYSTTAFSEEAVSIIKNHDVSKPLFLYLAYQAVHAPAEVPAQYEKPYAHISDPQRRTFAGMLSAADEGIANWTQALKDKGMYDDALIILTTDNGGPVVGGDAIGAQNWPMRGGKHSAYQGGVRGTGLIRPPKGVFEKTNGTYNNLMHLADWLPTICEAVGSDCKTANRLDGVSHWSAMKANTTAQLHKQLVLGNSTDMCKDDCGFAVRDNRWKLIRGSGGQPYTYSMPCSSTGGKCNIAYNLCLPNNDLFNVPKTNLDHCCGLCMNTTKCTAFTFNAGANNTCFLKAGVPQSDVEYDTNCISGAPDSKALPPVPHVAGDWSRSNGVLGNYTQLFDLLNDPNETTDVAGKNPKEYQALEAYLDQELKSYYEAKNDPACPFTGWRVVPNKGKVMEPWC